MWSLTDIITIGYRNLYCCSKAQSFGFQNTAFPIAYLKLVQFFVFTLNDRFVLCRAWLVIFLSLLAPSRISTFQSSLISLIRFICVSSIHDCYLLFIGHSGFKESRWFWPWKIDWRGRNVIWLCVSSYLHWVCQGSRLGDCCRNTATVRHVPSTAHDCRLLPDGDGQLWHPD